MIPIPELFLQRMERYLGREYPAFVEALGRPPQSGLRVNTLKLTPEAFQQIAPFALGARIPWCPAAFLLSGEERPGKHPFHQAGLYYLQDPSAMAAAEALAPRPGEWVLDLAAAPGGKTTHLAALMQGEGLLVANEIKEKRLGHLVMNLERWGAPNVIVTNESPERLVAHFGAIFDRVLLDAPCSGEGMFRKDVAARADWSEKMVAGCAARQNVLLRLAARLVRPGGYLLYSTCTFAAEENEGVVGAFLEQHPDFETIALPFSPEGALAGEPGWLSRPWSAEVAAGLRRALRLLPHRIAGEGHFLCLLRRKESKSPPQLLPFERVTKLPVALQKAWQAFLAQTVTPQARLHHFSDFLYLWHERLYYFPGRLPDLRGLRHVNRGLWLGTFKKERFEPAHPLALFLRLEEAQNVLNLPAESPELQAYLRGEPLPNAGEPGWVLVCADGWPLGWGKRSQGMVKNHYPKGWQRR